MSAKDSKEYQISGLEHQLAEAKKFVAHSAKVEQFTSSKLFKEIIEEAYFTQAASRFVHQSADPMLDDKQRADALNMAQAAGHFKRWIIAQEKLGETAESSIQQLEEQIDYLRSLSDAEFEQE